MIQACREDIAESIKLKRRLEGYRLGAYSGGCGPSADELQPRRHLDQKNQVAQFCKELYAYVESGDELHFVNLSASWMKSLVTNMILSEKQAEWKELLPQLGNQILINASPRKEAHEAAKFQHSLKIVKSCRNSFHVNIKVNGQHSQEATIIHNTGATYKVTLAKMPFCDGCKCCTSCDICSHILWVMLYVYKVAEESELLHQRALLNSELESIFKSTTTF